MGARVLVLAGASHSLINFRLPLLKEMIRRGHEVLAVAPDDWHASDVRRVLEQDGVLFETARLERRGVNPLRDLSTIQEFVSLLRKVRPDRLLAYMTKPVVYGGLAARRVRSVSFFPMITGLGYPFAENGDFRQRLVRHVVRSLYRSGLKSARCVIFQNDEDRILFESLGLVPDGTDILRVFGSGVDLTQYRPQPLSTEPIFVMLSRLLVAKGVEEYVAAARIVKETHPSARFILAGSPDPGPAGIEMSRVRRWEDEGLINYLGHLDDVRSTLARSRFLVLPSYYREGVPRSLLEGLATGRPLITTDTVGCRDTVENGRNGLLVPPRSAAALASAMTQLLRAPSNEVSKMAEASLELARTRFDVRAVNADILGAMNL